MEEAAYRPQVNPYAACAFMGLRCIPPQVDIVLFPMQRIVQEETLLMKYLSGSSWVPAMVDCAESVDGAQLLTEKGQKALQRLAGNSAPIGQGASSSCSCLGTSERNLSRATSASSASLHASTLHACRGSGMHIVMHCCSIRLPSLAADATARNPNRCCAVFCPGLACLASLMPCTPQDCVAVPLGSPARSDCKALHSKT